MATTRPPRRGTAVTAVQGWSAWYVTAWVLWGVAFFVLEAWALRRHDDGAPPLTHVVRRWVPVFVTIPGLLWLLWHGVDVYLLGG
jgi:hypothetical protein